MNEYVLLGKQRQYFLAEAKDRSDGLMNYFLPAYFITGLLLANYYGTWLIAFCVGGISMLAYYSVKIFLPGSKLYQYVLSSVFGVFMAQYIYQMHGLFEMHFFAYIGSALLITYQNWKLQIPLTIVVFLHHAVFSYLQNIGYTYVYFTQLDNYTFQTFIIHIVLTLIIFCISGLWAYQFKKSSETQIEQTIKVASLEEEARLFSERKRYAEILEEKNNILESIGDAFFALDKDWMITYWNKVAAKILNKPKDEIVGRNVWEVFPDAVELEAHLKYQQAIETKIPVHFEQFYEPLQAWYEISAYPLAGGLSVYLRDITARKSSEIRLLDLNDNLKRQTKALAYSNAELEQFAYVASHDLQEPLRMVSSFLTQLEKKYYDIIDDKGKQYIHFAVDGARRMRQIILDLLEFSRVGRTEHQLELVNFNELLADTLTLYRKLIEEKQAEIQFDHLPTIQTYKGPLRQVFQNLLGNSLKYQKQGIAPRISITCQESATEWEFAVSDNGIGIAESDFEDVFILFKRLQTGGVYPGTGIGLAVAKKIIEQMGGKIWLSSTQGQGTIFYFTIIKPTKI